MPNRLKDKVAIITGAGNPRPGVAASVQLSLRGRERALDRVPQEERVRRCVICAVAHPHDRGE